MDMLSELAPNYTPYRYGFNNPVYFSDPSGLFESWSAAREYQLSNGLSGSIIECDCDDNYWYIESKGSMIFKIGDQIYKTYEIDGEWTAEISSAGGGGSDSDSSNPNSFWKKMEIGGMFRVWGVMTDIPGFKPNSRKRSAVDVDMNYDEAYQRSAGKSLRWGKNFWKRLKEQLEGMDNRSKQVAPESKSKRITVDKEKPVTKEEREIIKIQMRNFMYDSNINKVVPRTHYQESIYERQVPDYIKMMEQDSMNQLPNR